MLALQHRFAGGGNRIQWRAQDLDRIGKHFGATARDLAGVLLRYASEVQQASTVELDANGGASNEKIAEATFVVSTAAVDSYGDTVNQDGWKLARFRTNPVVLWAHDGRTLPIGRAVNTWVEDGKLKSTVAFDSERFAQRVAGMVQRRTLRATSVGFLPGEWEFSKDPKRPFGIDFKSGHELIEWSIVSVPANPETLLISTSASKSAPMKVDPLEDYRRRVARAMARGSRP